MKSNYRIIYVRFSIEWRTVSYVYCTIQAIQFIYLRKFRPFNPIFTKTTFTLCRCMKIHAHISGINDYFDVEIPKKNYLILENRGKVFIDIEKKIRSIGNGNGNGKEFIQSNLFFNLEQFFCYLLTWVCV